MEKHTAATQQCRRVRAPGRPSDIITSILACHSRQARRLAALAPSVSSGSYRASRMGPSRELGSSQSPHQSGGNDRLAAEMASMAVDQQVSRRLLRLGWGFCG